MERKTDKRMNQTLKCLPVIVNIKRRQTTKTTTTTTKQQHKKTWDKPSESEEQR